MVIALWILIAVGVILNGAYWIPKANRLARAWCEQHPAEAARMTGKERATVGGAWRCMMWHAVIFTGLVCIVGGAGTAILNGG